jgi:hypothetical protein
MRRYFPILFMIVFPWAAQAQITSNEYAEGISRVRFDTTCNCFQSSDETVHPNPKPPTPFKGMTTGETYQGIACLTTNSPTKYGILTSRRNYHTGGACGSEPTSDIAAPGKVCWKFNISINRDDIQCDYHWIIKLKAPSEMNSLR